MGKPDERRGAVYTEMLSTNMKSTPVICIAIISGSASLFFWSFYHYLYLMGGEYELAERIAAVTSLGRTVRAPTEHTLVPGNAGITEERAIIIMFAFACLGGLISFAYATIQRIAHGAYRLYVPLVFSSLCLVACIIYTSYKYGLDYYA